VAALRRARAAEPERCVVIDAAEDAETVSRAIRSAVAKRLAVELDGAAP